MTTNELPDILSCSKKLLLGRRDGLSIEGGVFWNATCMDCSQLDEKRNGDQAAETAGPGGNPAAVQRWESAVASAVETWSAVPGGSEASEETTGGFRGAAFLRSPFAAGLVERAYPHIPNLQPTCQKLASSVSSPLQKPRREKDSKKERLEHGLSGLPLRSSVSRYRNSRAFDYDYRRQGSVARPGRAPGTAFGSANGLGTRLITPSYTSSGPDPHPRLRPRSCAGVERPVSGRSIALGLGFAGVDAFTAPLQGVLISSLAIGGPHWSSG
ncbi:uncharacterized protein TRIVIDRAFT_61583 [Trichoderma virens Gv29-8]|uniref:Uncharacterized protein n=1 Tax=Hypocrea virens (strain Gv29-8 / FGSC 10586) TaxID=413071 RepID=G9MKS7_HYPVG|nr:uncharacterized protein TRIVIDRAFT_61583 [Trichoderma virens Gv29-8]EHK24823.1 hypothetical protein TRIVIDRAFT_61583 [Trichoderma virens Gv29-8]